MFTGNGWYKLSAVGDSGRFVGLLQPKNGPATTKSCDVVYLAVQFLASNDFHPIPDGN